MDLQLAERVYVVTGGTRGLGLAAAEALVGDGARVVVSSRDPAAVRAAVERLGGDANAVGVAASTADPATPELLLAAARERWGGVHGAVLSTGGPPNGPLVGSTDGQWTDAFESVVLGPLRIARAVAAAAPPGGAIAFVLSSSVKSPIPKLAISNGLRPGLAMAAKTLADELGPSGIRVIGLLPGRINTDRQQELDAADPSRRAGAEATIPLRRYGEVAEFGRVAAFVVSPAASYMTGVMVAVDGGSLRSL